MDPVRSFQPPAGLQQTLRQFHISSMRSLGGPAAFTARWQDNNNNNNNNNSINNILNNLSHKSDPAAPLLPGPLLVPPDRSTARCETVLERETISCFVVGGEKRLCLPQILNTALRDFSLQQINAVCDELHVYCSRCTAEQLEILKVVGVLPFSAPSCGLITQTDAERLCNALVRGGVPPRPGVSPAGDDSVPVYHECFGRCDGVLVPELYVSPGAACVQCADCGLVFPARRFVVHSHRRRENRTCHWGFDSANWRAYLLLDRDRAPVSRHADLQLRLEQIKEKFRRKRPADVISTDTDFSPIPSKKSRPERPASPSEEKKQADWLQSLTSSANKDLKQLQFKQRPSAFRPWSPRVPTTHLDRSFSKAPECLAPVVCVAPEGLKTEEKTPPALTNTHNTHNIHNTHNTHNKPNKHNPTDQNQQPPPAAHQHQTDSDTEIEVDTCDDGPGSGSVTNTVQCVEVCEVRRSCVSSVSELELLRQTLYSDLSSRETRDQFLQEIISMRSKQEERLTSALQTKRRLQQELEFVRATKKGRVREAVEVRRNLRKEIERLRVDNDRKLRDATESCDRMRREVERERDRERDSRVCDKGCEAGHLRSKYSTQIEDLQVKLQQAEADRELLREELVKEREARQSLERAVLQLQQQLGHTHAHTHTRQRPISREDGQGGGDIVEAS